MRVGGCIFLTLSRALSRSCYAVSGDTGVPVTERFLSGAMLLQAQSEWYHGGILSPSLFCDRDGVFYGERIKKNIILKNKNSEWIQGENR